MKKMLKILGVLGAILVILFIVLELSLNQIVLKGVNAAAPGLLGVPVTLQGSDFSLVRGRAALQGLHVGNPEGFKTPGLLDLGSVSVRLDNASLLTDTIVIREIAIDGLVVTYEKGLLNSNLGALIDQLSAGEDEPEADEKEAPPAAEEKPAKKVIIEKLTITGSKMNFSVTGAAALTGGGSIPVPLPPITLTDLGKDQDGVTLLEAVQRILNEIAGAASTAIAGSAKLLGQGVEAVGEGAVEAGKAAVEGAADVGKALGGAATDAGKAVGDALKNVNPFKKK